MFRDVGIVSKIVGSSAKQAYFRNNLLAHEVLQAACGGIKLIKAYLPQKCHSSSFLEGGACFD